VTLNPSGAYSTGLGSEWEAFYASKRSASTRRRDRTKLNRLAQHGDVRFVSAASPDEAIAILDTLIEQKSRAFARMGVPNIFVPPGRRDFYLELATGADTSRLTHVSQLRVGETSACTNLGLSFRGCYYHVLASHEGGDLSTFSPGAAHLRELLRHAIGLGLHRFDFTIGDEPYKREWSDTELALYDHAAAATLRGWPAAGRLRPPPALEARDQAEPGALAAGQPRSRGRRVAPRVFARPEGLRDGLAGPVPTMVTGSSDRFAPASGRSRPVGACVMGSMDLVRPLALAGIHSAVVSRPGTPSLYSRFTTTSCPCRTSRSARTSSSRRSLASVPRSPPRPSCSTRRIRSFSSCPGNASGLSRAFRFVIGDPVLIEDLVDKARFQVLADRLDLPVPKTWRIRPAEAGARAISGSASRSSSSR
jgi:hypothetical protein